MPTEKHLCPVTRATTGPFYHFFGYYDKFSWDATDRYLLGMQVAFMDRPPTPEDVLVIGVIDTQSDNLWRPVASTVAWYWQQGTMLHWMPSAPDREIIYNCRTREGYGATILDIRAGESRQLPRPIYALSPDGKYAVSVNFARIHRTRRGYGYVGVTDQWADQLAPEEDGIFLMDLETGEAKLIISLAQIATWDPEPSMGSATHWFNHLQFNTAGTRLLFLNRWRDLESGRPHVTRMFTANPDGSDIRLLGHEGMVSHFDWRDEDHILAWSTHNGENHYHLYSDGSGRIDVVGEDVFDQDGHCSYSPDRRWILTDTYPDQVEHKRTLILYDPARNRRVDIGRFYSDPAITGEFRCDLHPRWSRDGKKVCFDSIHEGERQIYLVDVSEVVS